jgi:hypothetical protein
VEPVAAELLVTLAAGDGSTADRRAWADLGALIRQPFQRIISTHMPPASTGEPEMTALERAPEDSAAAQRLSMAIALRAMVDAEFYNGLLAWQAHAETLRTGSGDVHNSIDGSSVYGSSIQARDISHITINSAAPPAKPGRKTRDSDDSERRKAVERAAYNRLLSRLPQPEFVRVRLIPAGGMARLTGGRYRPESPAYFGSGVDAMLQRLKEIADGKIDVPGVYSVTPEHLRFDQAASYLRSLRLETVGDVANRYLGVYSTTSVNKFLSEYRQCLSDYFNERV